MVELNSKLEKHKKLTRGGGERETIMVIMGKIREDAKKTGCRGMHRTIFKPKPEDSSSIKYRTPQEFISICKERGTKVVKRSG